MSKKSQRKVGKRRSGGRHQRSEPVQKTAPDQHQSTSQQKPGEPSSSQPSAGRPSPIHPGKPLESQDQVGSQDQLGEDPPDEADDDFEDEDFEDFEPTPEELFELALDAVERAVDTLLRWPDPETAEDLACELRDEMDDLNGDWDDSTELSVFAIFRDCLFGPRKAGFATGSVIDWVAQHLGAEAGADAQLLGGVIGYTVPPGLTYRQVEDRLSADVVTVMFWLTTGLVAVAGQGDAGWLRQFVPCYEPEPVPSS